MSGRSWLSWRGLGQHLMVGTAVTGLCAVAGARPWLALLLLSGLGAWHEHSDGDLSTAAGAPWNGLLDLMAFILPALLNLLFA